MSNSFTKSEWINVVNEKQIGYRKGQIKKIIGEVVDWLQDVILRGDMLTMPKVGKLVVVVKKERFGVRNVSDLTQPTFTLPSHKKLCFYPSTYNNSLDESDMLNPDFKKLGKPDRIAGISHITNDHELSLLIYNVLINVLESLLIEDSKYSRVEIRGLMSLTRKLAKEKIGRNPKTGEVLIIEEKLKYSFKQPLSFKKLFKEESN